MTPRAQKLILASRSPRRHQLLLDAGYEFQVSAPRDSAECGVCSHETPPELVARLARQKAEDVALRISKGIVLGADTVVECRGHILGKPENREHARQMLGLLSDRVHHVYSGICLWRRPDDETHVRVDVTKLRMAKLTPLQIDLYLDTDMWEGKAGAFGYQDRHNWLEIVHGSESNVVGLPIELLEEMLQQMC